MVLPVFLIVFSLIAALLLLVVNSSLVRRAIVVTSAIVLTLGSLLLISTSLPFGTQFFDAESAVVENLIAGLKLIMAVYLIYVGLKYKRFWVPVLVVLQIGPLLWAEHTFGQTVHVEHNLFIDHLSIVLALVIGVIGSLICVYALGYMKAFHEHAENKVRDNRKFFFFVLFLFLSAMYGVVFANNLIWLYFFWEITTLCSFFLIGYKQDTESRNNAFRALEFNLVGGLAFVVAIVYLFASVKTIELDKVMAFKGGLMMLPLVLMAIAGCTKSAQLPFSTWLLGAMVAPTPVSALLHSSTMVKAGVYLVLRFAPAFENTLAGFLVALVGAVTFMLTSFIAITQNDAKKILAYSTISNLGLIILCAGIGTYESVWAGILLIIFHAVAKSLLFLCVGVVEDKIHSRSVDDMTGLIMKMPKVSIMMQIGMAGMFLAPFGMLISKWAVLKAIVDCNPLLSVFLIFGSAATLFYWVKWMGQIITVTSPTVNVEEDLSRTEWAPLKLLALFTIFVCALFPVIASFLIEPYIMEIYGTFVSFGRGNILIMSIMLSMVMLFPLSFFNYGKHVKVVDAYLGGGNTAEGTSFVDSFGAPQTIAMKNYYLGRYFDEKKLLRLGIVISSVLLLVILGVVFV